MKVQREERGSFIVLVVLSIVPLMMLAFLGAMTGLVLIQAMSVEGAFKLALEAAGGTYGSQRETMAAGMGGTIPPGFPAATFIPQATAKAQTVMTNHLANAHFVSFPVSPTIVYMSTGVWDFQNSAGCDQSCFTASADASTVNALMYRVQTSVNPSQMIGSNLFGATQDIPVSRMGIVYYHEDVSGPVVVWVSKY